MENNDAVPRYTVSFGISLAIASVVSAMLVILKEKCPAVMGWMKRATGHHWATHSLIAMILFIALGLILARANGGKGIQMTATSLVGALLGGVVTGLVLISGFYLILD